VSKPSTDPTSALVALMAANRLLRAGAVPPAAHAGEARGGSPRPLAFVWADRSLEVLPALFPGIEGRVVTDFTRSGLLEASEAQRVAGLVEAGAIPLLVVLAASLGARGGTESPPPGGAAESSAFAAIESLLVLAPALRAAVHARRTRVVAGIATDAGEILWLGEHARQGALLGEPRPGEPRPGEPRPGEPPLGAR
jgi:hypothetical protein